MNVLPVGGLGVCLVLCTENFSLLRVQSNPSSAG